MLTRKIAHLTSVHPRYDTRIFLKECTSLANNGFSVSLVVADGKGDEQKNNVAIYDVGASKGRFDRIRNAPKRVFKKAVELDADIYHFHDPELIPIGLKLKKLGKKVVFDIHENTDLQILVKEWIPQYLRKPIAWLYSTYENLTCKKFDALIVPQISMQKKYSKFCKTELIANFPSEIVNIDNRDNLNKFNLLYSGGLGKARGLFNMLELISKLVVIDTRYQLTLAGPMSDKDLEKAKTHPGWKNTKYLGVLNKEDVYSKYQSNTIGLILFENVGQYYMSYALKLFEYMQCGMIIIMPNFGDWLTFNEEFNAGLNVDTKDITQVAKAINNLTKVDLNKCSSHNIKLAKSKFIWSTQEKKLIELYEGIVNGV